VNDDTIKEGSVRGLTSRLARPLALVAVLALAAAACGGGNEASGGSGAQTGRLSGTVRIDGSSTVAPLSETAAEMFQNEQPGVRVTVGTSGTGGGFEKFCNGETDISDASRPIRQSEIDACTAKGIRYDQLTVGNDGIAVIVSPQNTWAQCLTVEQLKKVWEPGSRVSSWRDVDPSFPDERLALFGAGTDSGTFDYFTEAINGRSGASRTDYNATEDDNVTVNGVSGTRGGLGYLGLSYVEESGGRVDGGGGCVAPTTQTVQNGTYKPLGRPVFIYPKADALQRPEVAAFVRFYIDNIDTITKEALYVPLTPQQKAESLAKLQGLIAS
jgi:phosphate transport system substrate-binding protein